MALLAAALCMLALCVVATTAMVRRLSGRLTALNNRVNVIERRAAAERRYPPEPDPPSPFGGRP